MHRALVTLPLGLCVLSLTACPAKAPPRVQTAPASPPAVRVPPGCEKNQSGDYFHAQNPAFRYLGQDDGGTLTLAVVRAWADGGVESPDAGSVGIVLHRTPDGFVGETRATGGGKVVDLMSLLQRSLDKTGSARSVDDSTVTRGSKRKHSSARRRTANPRASRRA
jgi:hypothetical protein